MRRDAGQLAARFLIVTGGWTLYALFAASQNYLSRAYTTRVAWFPAFKYAALDSYALLAGLWSWLQSIGLDRTAERRGIAIVPANGLSAGLFGLAAAGGRAPVVVYLYLAAFTTSALAVLAAGWLGTRGKRHWPRRAGLPMAAGPSRPGS